ncbi:MAG TPA: hypothetical protein DCW83_11820 [Saprospirales bacterium]|jgi:hypothetical protein|nr:hypothetical protein [Saprospirales bacterium]
MSSKYMLLSEYSGSSEFKNRKAEVLRSFGDHPYYGIRMYIDGESLGIEWYKAHNEMYAENAAENYVSGIKNYERV